MLLLFVLSAIYFKVSAQNQFDQAYGYVETNDTTSDHNFPEWSKFEEKAEELKSRVDKGERTIFSLCDIEGVIHDIKICVSNVEISKNGTIRLVGKTVAGAESYANFSIGINGVEGLISHYSESYKFLSKSPKVSFTCHDGFIINFEVNFRKIYTEKYFL